MRYLLALCNIGQRCDQACINEYVLHKRSKRRVRTLVEPRIDFQHTTLVVAFRRLCEVLTYGLQIAVGRPAKVVPQPVVAGR